MNVLLAYVVRATDRHCRLHHTFRIDGWHLCAKHAGSLEEELIKRALHSHSAAVYYVLEEATRSTECSASIKPFQGKKNGKNAWLSIVKEHAGDDQ